MTSEQPSLFDQLTPSDALRDDLDWLDSLQETKPSTPPRKPKNRRSNRKHGIEPVQHDDKHGTTTTPPTETTVPATVQDTFALPPVSEGATDTTPVPQSTGVENDQTAERPEPSMPSSDTRPMPAFPLPPRPAMEDANVPDEAEDTLTSMIPVGDETPSDIPPVATETASGGIRTTVSLQDVANPDGPSEDARTMVWVRRGLIGALTFILLLVLFAIMGSHSAAQTQSDAKHEAKAKKKGKAASTSDSLEQKAQTMFTGDAEQISNDVRDLLNAPENSNVDTLSTLLYRHGRQDLAEATDLYDAIGQQKDIDTIRTLAREWYPQAMRAAIEARHSDLSDGLDNTAKSVTTIQQDNLENTQGCGDIKNAYETAKQLVDSKSDDYDALTKAQQDLTTATSGCATNLVPKDLEKVFGQPQGTLKEDKE